MNSEKPKTIKPKQILPYIALGIVILVLINQFAISNPYIQTKDTIWSQYGIFGYLGLGDRVTNILYTSGEGVSIYERGKSLLAFLYGVPPERYTTTGVGTSFNFNVRGISCNFDVGNGIYSSNTHQLKIVYSSDGTLIKQQAVVANCNADNTATISLTPQDLGRVIYKAGTTSITIKEEIACNSCYNGILRGDTVYFNLIVTSTSQPATPTPTPTPSCPVNPPPPFCINGVLVSQGNDANGCPKPQICAGETPAVTPTIPQVPQTGFISVTTSPASGASVFIDDGYYGVTPNVFSVPAGNHIVKVVQQGYSDYIDDAVPVLPGQNTPITIVSTTTNPEVAQTPQTVTTVPPQEVQPQAQPTQPPAVQPKATVAIPAKQTEKPGAWAQIIQIIADWLKSI